MKVTRSMIEPLASALLGDGRIERVALQRTPDARHSPARLRRQVLGLGLRLEEARPAVRPLFDLGATPGWNRWSSLRRLIAAAGRPLRIMICGPTAGMVDGPGRSPRRLPFRRLKLVVDVRIVFDVGTAVGATRRIEVDGTIRASHVVSLAAAALHLRK